jgi:phenylpropionate dioxygenase-like ring-hydroxylating dioxygenase large terminal subunit
MMRSLSETSFFDQPIFRRFWYPTLPQQALVAGPQPFTLLEESLVLWLDPQGEPAAVSDRCCHRSALLSKGCVIEGMIQCPYHGWQFNPRGDCILVPQQPDQPIPKAFHLQSFACVVRYGFVWVCLADPLEAVPNITEAADLNLRFVEGFQEIWHCHPFRLVENFMDLAHISFVHHQTFGDEQHPIPPPYDLLAETSTGLHVRSLSPARNSPLLQQAMGTAGSQTIRIRDLIWFRPITVRLHLTFDNGLINILVAMATPIDREHTQVSTFYLRSDRAEDVSDQRVQAFHRTVALEDKQMMEAIAVHSPLEKQQHMELDSVGIALRRQLMQLINP